MRIRIVQLRNNFYEVFRKPYTEDETSASYCAFGYFDAIETKYVRNLSEDEQYNVWRLTADINIESLNGKCMHRNLVCVIEEDQKDDDFWQNAKTQPILFVSLLRINPKQIDIEKIEKKGKEINKSINKIMYYTSDHSELIIMCCGKSLSKCREDVLGLKDQFDVLKMYSIFGVQELYLTLCEGIYRKELENNSEVNMINDSKIEHIEIEEVNCRLKAIVRDDSKVNQFIAKVKLFLEPELIRIYEVFGNSDLYIEIDKVSLDKLLPLYKMGNIFTHSGYGEIFYNIETEIISGKERKLNV